MAKHQLIISKGINWNYPVRSEAGELKETRTLVINWSGEWKPNEHPDQHMVAAPGDELEIVLAAGQDEGGSLWLFARMRPLRSLLLPLPDDQRQENMERVDIKSGSVLLEVNRTIDRDAGESRYDLRISALGEVPLPIVGQGQAGTLTASKP